MPERKPFDFSIEQVAAHQYAQANERILWELREALRAAIEKQVREVVEPVIQDVITDCIKAYASNVGVGRGYDTKHMRDTIEVYVNGEKK